MRPSAKRRRLHVPPGARQARYYKKGPSKLPMTRKWGCAIVHIKLSQLGGKTLMMEAQL
jgi:hypothetical protein